MQAEIWHYGIKGQKHGLRRFQNEDGSLTPEGKERYGIGDGERQGIWGGSAPIPRNAKVDGVGRNRRPLPVGTKTGPLDPRSKAKARDLSKDIHDLTDMIKSNKKEPEQDEASKKEQALKNLKSNYGKLMGGALLRGVYGYALSNFGKVLSISTRHKTAGFIAGMAGKLLKFDAGFRAAVGTGAYFVGKGAIQNGTITVADIDQNKHKNGG